MYIFTFEFYAILKYDECAKFMHCCKAEISGHLICIWSIWQFYIFWQLTSVWSAYDIRWLFLNIIYFYALWGWITVNKVLLTCLFLVYFIFQYFPVMSIDFVMDSYLFNTFLVCRYLRCKVAIQQISRSFRLVQLNLYTDWKTTLYFPSQDQS